MRINFLILPLLIFVFALISSESLAQKKKQSSSGKQSSKEIKAPPKKKKKKVEVSKNARIGDRYFENDEYFMAAEYYGKSIKENPKDYYSYFKEAECFKNYFDYKRAEKAYEKVVNEALEDFPLARFWFAQMQKNNGKYDLAKENFEIFLKEFEPENEEEERIKKLARIELNGCILVINEFQKPVRNYNFKNLKSPVNSTSSDYAAVVFKSDSSIVITSTRKGSKGQSVDSRMGETYSDNYRFTLMPNGNWVREGDKDNYDIVNTDKNDGAGVFNIDHTKYYYTSCFEGNGECAIYLSELKSGKWTKSVRLNDNVNYPGHDNVQPALTTDGDTLIFVSKRPDGLGMHDLWYSVKKGPGEDWMPAVNMGPGINTPYSDVSPSFYKEDHTLFFASNGREGFGGLDIFMAYGPNWSKVRNLGLPFNSNRDDFYFVLGDRMGYLSSNREGGLGGDDIYSFNIESRESIIAVVYKDSIDEYKSISVLANLKFSQNGEPAIDIPAYLMDDLGNILFSKNTDKEGRVRFDNLPSNRNYSVKSSLDDPSLLVEYVYEEGDYKSFSLLGNLKFKPEGTPAPAVPIELLDDDGNVLARMMTNEEGKIRFDNLASDKNYRLRIADADTKVTSEYDFGMDDMLLLGSVKPETKTLFENIYFDLDKADLRPESRKVLDELTIYVKKNQEVQVEMRAYTDALGSDEYNVELSKARGDAAINYLVKKGIDRTHLVVKPEGKTKPIATNENPIGRQLNRRLEFYIVGGEGYETKAMAYVPEAKASLDQIAAQFGMTTAEMKALNALKKDEVDAYIPLRVRRTGDSDIIAPITMAASERAISDGLLTASMNRLVAADGEPMSVPKKYIPKKSSSDDGELIELKSNNRFPEPPVLNEGEEYVIVEPENTLYSIARKYGMKADEIKALNNLKSNTIFIGQRLKVKPASDIVVDETRYVVKEGDTMFDLAKRFNLTIQQLKELNGLESNMLFERMVLKVK